MNHKNYMNYKQAADYMDYSVSTLRRGVEEGKIPRSKDERLVRFSADVLDSYMKNNEGCVTKEVPAEHQKAEKTLNKNNREALRQALDL